MPRISTYNTDDTVSLSDRILGSDANTGDLTKNYTVESLFEKYNEYSNQVDLINSDLDSVTYFYYGGNYLLSGVEQWVIIRYDKLNADLRTTATQTTNPIYTGLGTAWTNRQTLTYN
jgi:hypothetical protein